MGHHSERDKYLESSDTLPGLKKKTVKAVNSDQSVSLVNSKNQ